MIPITWLCGDTWWLNITVTTSVTRFTIVYFETGKLRCNCWSLLCALFPSWVPQELHGRQVIGIGLVRPWWMKMGAVNYWCSSRETTWEPEINNNIVPVNLPCVMSKGSYRRLDKLVWKVRCLIVRTRAKEQYCACQCAMCDVNGILVSTWHVAARISMFEFENRLNSNGCRFI